MPDFRVDFDTPCGCTWSQVVTAPTQATAVKYAMQAFCERVPTGEVIEIKELDSSEAAAVLAAAEPIPERQEAIAAALRVVDDYYPTR